MCVGCICECRCSRWPEEGDRFHGIGAKVAELSRVLGTKFRSSKFRSSVRAVFALNCWVISSVSVLENWIASYQVTAPIRWTMVVNQSSALVNDEKELTWGTFSLLNLCTVMVSLLDWVSRIEQWLKGWHWSQTPSLSHQSRPIWKGRMCLPLILHLLHSWRAWFSHSGFFLKHMNRVLIYIFTGVSDNF